MSNIDMSYTHGIDNYAEKYSEYGEKVLKDAKASLEKAGIKVFPVEVNPADKNTDSYVIINKNKQPDTPQSKEIKADKAAQSAHYACWIREALPTSYNPESLSSKILSNNEHLLGDAVSKASQNNNSANQSGTTDNADNDESIDNMDILDIEGDIYGVSTLSNANDDEGEGNLLQTFFEKDIDNGFHTNNFAGTKYENNITNNVHDGNVILYSDNLYCTNNKKTSIIFGGTANISCMTNDESQKDIDYNAYGFLKQKGSNFTYGLGAIDAKNDKANNLNINVGAMHNTTGIYAILKKDLCFIPGLPTHTNTNINIGIGRASGLLEPDSYNKNKDTEEIDDIDEQTSDFENSQSNLDDSDTGNSNPLRNSTINLIISDTNNHKEYGIKFGQMFRKTTKKQNYAFIQPYAQISNIAVDSDDNGSSKEGAALLLGANAGQNMSFGNRWRLKTKGLMEASRSVIVGSKPNDYILANANFIAENDKFKGQVALGAFANDSQNYCKYAKTKVSYKFNKNFNTYVKAGIAKYTFNAETGNKIFELTMGAHYNF